jgi:hypothetical protein
VELTDKYEEITCSTVVIKYFEPTCILDLVDAVVWSLFTERKELYKIIKCTGMAKTDLVSVIMILNKNTDMLSLGKEMAFCGLLINIEVLLDLSSEYSDFVNSYLSIKN